MRLFSRVHVTDSVLRGFLLRIGIISLNSSWLTPKRRSPTSHHIPVFQGKAHAVGEGFLFTAQSFLLLSVGTELLASRSMETD